MALNENIPDAPDAALAQQTSGGSQNQQNATPATSLEGKQTKRILGIVPNFRSVSVDEKLPPQSIGEKLKTTTLDSFDYSAFIFAGVLAGVSFAENSYPEFHQGAAGYGRYYWHTLADQAVENYNVEFVFPNSLQAGLPLLHAGARWHRQADCIFFFARVDYPYGLRNETFNASEVIGAGSASAISSLYYPGRERTWTKIGQHWITNIGLDGMTFIFKEFWPDVNNAVFHQKQ